MKWWKLGGNDMRNPSLAWWEMRPEFSFECFDQALDAAEMLPIGACTCATTLMFKRPHRPDFIGREDFDCAAFAREEALYALATT